CDPVVPAVVRQKCGRLLCPAQKSCPTSGTLTEDGAGDGLNSKTKHLVNVLMQNESTKKKVQYLTLVMTKYMEIIHKQISDLTIKYILCFMVKKVLDYIRESLVPTLLGLPNFVHKGWITKYRADF
ncbi:dynamin-1, partial [Caerostris darwini]